MPQHLGLQPTHLKQSLAVVEVGLSTLDVSLAKLLGKDCTALSHVIYSLGNVEVLLHTLQQLLGVLHAGFTIRLQATKYKESIPAHDAE